MKLQFLIIEINYFLLTVDNIINRHVDFVIVGFPLTAFTLIKSILILMQI